MSYQGECQTERLHAVSGLNRSYNSQPEKAMAHPTLLVQSGPFKGRSLNITGAQSIGRAAGCDLELHGYNRVSRQHARFRWDGQTLSVNDTQSTNGLLVNGQKVNDANLRDGDQIQLGDFSALVRVPVPKSAPLGGVKGIAQKQATGWRTMGTPQRWGIVGTAAIVLGLGVVGLSGQGAPDAPAARVDNLPEVPAAPPAEAAQTQVAPAVEPVGGKLAPAALQNVKAATVLIAHRDGNGWAMGSGFALGDARRIVTNRHVVGGENGAVSDCRIIFEAGTPRERSVNVPAASIRVAPQTGGDFQDDLATITLDAGQTPALSAGRSEALQETDEVYAVGFPLGVQTLTLDGDLPSVSVKATRVERLQTNKAGAVSVIQLGGSVTHGNSGGPIVNNRGEVVGVISSGVEGTGMSYAIPMMWVNKLA